MMVRLRPTLPGDSWLIRSDLREVEVLELSALGHTCEACLTLGPLHCDAQTVFIGDEMAGMVGVMRYEDGNVLWGVFTTAIDRHPLAFIRASRRYVESLDCVVTNYVDARNTRAVDWFRWLGFEVSAPESYGLNGELFHKFTSAKSGRIHQEAA